MSEEGYHTPVEEYLEAIFSLAEEGTTVIAARVAERLGRTAASVSEMLDRLQDDGFILRSGRTISLTATGTRLATSVVRRHRLAERLLVDVIGLEWHKAHAEAGRWEHVISADVEERLIALLGDPATCPHGNSIPGSSNVAPRGGVTLDSVTLSGSYAFVRIAESLETNDHAMADLERAGALPGGVVSVAVGADRTWQVTGTDGVLTVDAIVGEQLFVAQLPGP